MCNVCNTKIGPVPFETSSRARTHWTAGTDKYSRRAYMRDWDKKTRIYVSVRGETILENLENRRNRPVALYKEVLFAAMPELKGRVRWSQYAGCSCPCSPGFIVDTVLRDEDRKPIDMWLTIGEKPAPKEPVVDMSYVEMATA